MYERNFEKFQSTYEKKPGSKRFAPMIRNTSFVPQEKNQFVHDEIGSEKSFCYEDAPPPEQENQIVAGHTRRPGLTPSVSPPGLISKKIVRVGFWL